MSGAGGQAWELMPEKPAVKDHEASISAWLINVPGAHPFWSWWSVGMIHLRDIPGVPPANKRYPEAEYEFMIYTIDPNRCPHPDPDKAAEGYPHLIPFDVSEQFHGVSDQDAARICEGAVRAIVAGYISPDQDYRMAWRRLLHGTIKHFQEGRHPLN